MYIFCTPVEEERSDGLTLRYDKPAIEWTEALSVGNGRLEAMVYGDVLSEHLQFNEEIL